MNPYIKKLNLYLSEHPPRYGYHDVDTLLKMLYRYYTECNPLDSAAIRQNFEKLNDCLSGLSVQENDKVIDTLTDLCQQYECLAFTTGIQIGVRLSSELNAE